MSFRLTTKLRRMSWVEGKDTSKTVGVNAHLDTIGLIVRGFNSDGTLRVRQLGGINYHSIEGETCHVVCRDGSVVDGQVICNHHSVHVFEVRSNYGAQRGQHCPSRLLLMFLLLKRLVRWASQRVQLLH